MGFCIIHRIKLIENIGWYKKKEKEKKRKKRNCNILIVKYISIIVSFYKKNIYAEKEKKNSIE